MVNYIRIEILLFTRRYFNIGRKTQKSTYFPVMNLYHAENQCSSYSIIKLSNMNYRYFILENLPE